MDRKDSPLSPSSPASSCVSSSSYTVSAGIWAMNILGAVGIIMVNKQLMSAYGFTFAAAVLPLWVLLGFTLLGNASLVATNFSLLLNSVGFYQISKVAVIPLVCLFESLAWRREIARGVWTAMAVVMVGVGLCTNADITLNVVGFCVATLAVVCSALHMMLIGWLQDHYATSSFDLLSQTAPLQAFLLLLIGPPLDFYLTSRSLLSFHFSPGALLFLLLSGLLAVACNLSVYLCIGRFSATTYQVLGHIKTVLVIGIGVVFFHSPLSLHSMLGMSLAVLGMAMYGRAMQCARITTSGGKTGRTGCVPGGVACCDDGMTVVKHAWGRVMHAWAWDEAERSFVPVAGRTAARGIGLAAGVGGGGGGLMVRASAAAPQLRVPLLGARDLEAGRG
ncbi:unnamed protein product [Closterium sp. Yama58-4]|nr:unnamed protein product [Closterium sp. Yama58-4]